MSTHEERLTPCDALRDDLAAIIDGDAETTARHADHLSGCDACRDLRHDARVLAPRVSAAGRDFVPPADLEAKLLGALDARGGAQRVEMRAATADEIESALARPPAAALVPALQADVPRPQHAPVPPPVATKKRSRAGLYLVLGGGGVLVAAAAAVALAVGLSGGSSGGSDDVAARATELVAHGRIARVARAGGDPGVGLEVCRGGATACTQASDGAELPAGSTVRTDEHTRARIELAEGTVLVLDQGSELAFDPVQPRRFMLNRGQLLADVAHLESAPHASFATSVGNVEVVGTKFVLTSAGHSANVLVTRGQVKVHGLDGSSADVAAGQEGLLAQSRPASAAPAVDLAQSMAFAEIDGPVAGTGDAPLAGIGELRAQRPGEHGEGRRLALAQHLVDVRVVGNVARTEITEVFHNDTDRELEGIYRFPLPPDAQIARLALDVHGTMEDGAFVEKDRAGQIWRGVIRHATPQAHRQEVEDFVWVPGPWSDPAMLEWQRGGRFELRIFPIPAHGERRIIIGYQQNVAPHGDGRRYTYPLPFGADPSLRVGHFEVHARVAGAENVRVSGYETQNAAATDGAQNVSFASDGFTPSGDLVLDYQVPGDDTELRAWTYQGTAAVAGAQDSCEHLRGDNVAQQVACNRATDQASLAADTRPYVAFALRPELPSWQEVKPRDYVVVVDMSQSMVGERAARAARLVSGVVSELDRRDRFTVLACDSTCRAMDGGPSAASSQAATDVQAFLSSVRAAGATDLVAQLRAAAHALDGKREPGRDVRVVYVGDGLATVGARRASEISAEVGTLARDPSITFTTVGIGTDADALALRTIADAGGGHYVPYVPGESTAGAAIAVLETTMGETLEHPTLELPAGIVDVSPAQLPAIRAGEEIIVTARLASGDVSGTVVLHGKVSGRAYEDRYPVTLHASTAAGNAFVPRLWASAKIADLETSGAPDARDRIVALSKGFGVMSRETSLLVLESEAMFRAYGVDRTAPTAQWTGNEAIETVTATGTVAQAHGDAVGLGSLGLMGAGRGGGGTGAGNLGLDDSSGFGANMGGLGRSANAPTGGSSSGVGYGHGAMRMHAHSAAGEDENSEADDSASTRDEEQRQAPAPRASRAAPAAAPAADLAAPATATAQAEAVAGGGGAAGGAAFPMQGNYWNDELGAYRQPNGVAPAHGAHGNGWVRAVWTRTGEVRDDRTPSSSELRSIAVADDALRAAPDSRDAHQRLFRALARTAELDRAKEIAQKWLGRDALDADALTALSDAVGRDGERDDALRLLTGIVDLRPDDRALQERLARAFERAGIADRACAHRVSVAEIARTDATALAAAVRCERATGDPEAATRLLAGLSDDVLHAQVETLAAQPADAERRTGDLTVTAQWTGGQDLDLSLVTPQGSRVSWMGGRTGAFGSDVTSTHGETLGLRRAPAGEWIVEIDRTADDASAPVSGTANVTVLGVHRTLSFTLPAGTTHAEIGRAVVTRVQTFQRVF